MHGIHQQISLIYIMAIRWRVLLRMKASLEKSRTFASLGIYRSKKENIQQSTQIQLIDQLGKYLGFRIFQGRPSRSKSLNSWIKGCSYGQLGHNHKSKQNGQPRGTFVKQNISLSEKLIWEILYHYNKLWILFLTTKYMKDEFVIDKSKDRVCHLEFHS
ncbi:hypothetical protein CR513_16473, partial [Mucuna pruriens]